MERIAKAKPNKFLTLTVWPLHLKAEFERLNEPIEIGIHRNFPLLKRTVRGKRQPPRTKKKGDEDPREAFDRTRKSVAELFRWFAKTGRKHEYVRILEETKLGYPHYHFLLRGERYLPQEEISSLWQQLAGSPIVDIRAIDDGHTAKYVTKYLAKQDAVPFTTRRVSSSRNFFTKEPKKETTTVLNDWQFHDPETSKLILQKWIAENAIHEISPQHWLIEDRYQGSEPPTRALEWLAQQQPNEPNPR